MSVDPWTHCITQQRAWNVRIILEVLLKAMGIEVMIQNEKF